MLWVLPIIRCVLEQRGVTFEQAIEIIANDGVLLDLRNTQIKE